MWPGVDLFRWCRGYIVDDPLSQAGAYEKHSQIERDEHAQREQTSGETPGVRSVTNLIVDPISSRDPLQEAPPFQIARLCGTTENVGQMIEPDAWPVPLVRIRLTNKCQGRHLRQFGSTLSSGELLKSHEGVQTGCRFLGAASLPLPLVYVDEELAPEILSRIGGQDADEIVKRGDRQTLHQAGTVGGLSQLGNVGIERVIQLARRRCVGQERRQMVKRCKPGQIDQS